MYKHPEGLGFRFSIAYIHISLPKSQDPTILNHGIDLGHALLLKLRIKILWSSTHLTIKFWAW